MNSKGFTTVDKSSANEDILAEFKACLDEISELLILMYGSVFDRVGLQRHIETTETRFQNAALKSGVQRVGNDPLRKSHYFIDTASQLAVHGLKTT